MCRALLLPAHNGKIRLIPFADLFDKLLPHEKRQFILHVRQRDPEGDGHLLRRFRIAGQLQKDVLVEQMGQDRPRLPLFANSAVHSEVHILRLIAAYPKFSCHIHTFLYGFPRARQSLLHGVYR